MNLESQCSNSDPNCGLDQRGGQILAALGMIAVVAGALRLGASMLAADTTGRRDAVYWVLAGTLTALSAI
jgi:hypothetical protein